MLSWNDFRIVKAIADCGSLTEAAKTLRINQSTVFRKLGQIETELDARLFKRSRSALTLTPRGEHVHKHRPELVVAHVAHRHDSRAERREVSARVGDAAARR